MTIQNPLFDRFWLAYPRKVGKGAARKSFEKHSPDEDTVEEWIQALNAQKRWRKRVEDKPKWELDKLGINLAAWPHPSTWLNQERFSDEIPSLDQHDYVPAAVTSQCRECNRILAEKESAPDNLCANCWSLQHCISGETWDFRQMHNRLKEMGLDKLEGESKESWGARCRDAFQKIESQDPGRVYGGHFLRLFG